MRTLFLTGFTPTRATGTGVRTYGVVAALARLGEVELAYRPFDAAAPSPAYARLEGVALRALRRERPPRRALAYGQARLRAVPHSLARGAAPELADAARAAPAGVRVVADGPTVAAALLGVARERPVAYCAHNLESAFRPGLPGERDSRRTLERFERRVLEAMEESWMVSPADLAGAARLAPGARLRLVPNVVDTAAIAPSPGRAAGARVLFVGDLTYAPNRGAAAFLCDEVMPRLWAELPDARLEIAGRGAWTSPDPRIDVLGFVDDLGARYAAAAAVAVPLLAGGGSPLKFVEALAHARPVVATSTAAAGLEAEPGAHFLQADGAGPFAAALAGVLRDGAPGIGERGRELAERRYSIDALARELAA